LQVEGHEGFVWEPIYLKVHWLSNPIKTFSAHRAGSDGCIHFNGINNLAKAAQSMLERIGMGSAKVYQRKLLVPRRSSQNTT
jgi:hypothetical protein